MTEIEYLESKIREDQKDVARLRRLERNKNMADELFEVYNSYCDAGFTPEQAWELFRTMFTKTIKGE